MGRRASAAPRASGRPSAAERLAVACAGSGWGPQRSVRRDPVRMLCRRDMKLSRGIDRWISEAAPLLLMLLVPNHFLGLSSGHRQEHCGRN